MNEMTEARLAEIERIYGFDATKSPTFGIYVRELIAEIRRLKRERKELLKLLKKAWIGAKHESCMHEGKLLDSPEPNWHCCDWAELADEIEEALKKAKGERGE